MESTLATPTRVLSSQRKTSPSMCSVSSKSVDRDDQFIDDTTDRSLDPPSLKFPPNIVDSTVRVLEGSSLNFTFVVEANPFPDPDDFQWYSATKVYPKGQYLRLAQAARDMTGYYTCKVNNTMLPFDSTTATVGASNLRTRITVNCEHWNVSLKYAKELY